jgi:hypothetical protein|tara:strand:+ start:202 stop:357 length:156 start_codon:yes stop_codon:yes gene_type:complete
MAKAAKKSNRQVARKSSSIGTGGRGRRCKISTSTMNKSKRLSTKKYRGQGR